jgi:long-chain fatty acid transport protein
MRTLKTLALLAVLLPAVAAANGYDVPNVNPRDLSMSGSGVAAQSDAEAAYANPAALSRLGPGLQLSVAASGLFLSTDWQDPSRTPAASSSTLDKPVTPPSVFASYGFKLAGYDAALGAGLNIPAGGNVFWPDGWGGRGRIITVDRKVYAGYLSGSFALSKWVRLGAGLVHYYGTEYLKLGVQPGNNNYGELSTKGSGTSWDVSIDTSPTENFSFSIDYKYLGTMKLKGDGHFVLDPALQAGADLQDQGVNHNLTYPSVLNVGIAFRPTASRKLLVTMAYTMNFYDVYRSDDFLGTKGFVKIVPRSYQNGQTFRMGAEYDASKDVQLRFGMLRDQSGQRRDMLSPTLPDSDATAGSVGAGWMLRPGLQLNAAVFYAVLDPVSSTGPEALAGGYSSHVWITSLGITWKADAGAR